MLTGPLALLSTAALLAGAPAALAQTASGLSTTPNPSSTTSTTTSAPAPQAVEPTPGEPAPAEPGTTTPVEPVVPAPTTVPSGPSSDGGLPVTAGGLPGAPLPGSGGQSSSAWTVAAIAFGALVLLALLIRGLWYYRGWDPRWVRRWRHAAAEAAWRLSLGWAEFRDFVRLGR